MKEYIKDSLVKRFEYTIETAWKLMKKYLKLEYGKTDIELTVNNIFRFMEGYGFIKDWSKWKNYYSNRNNTSHKYNQNKANEILIIIDEFILDCDYLYNKFNDIIKD